MNKLVSSISVNEELKFDNNRLIRASENYQLDLEYKMKGELDILATDNKLFNLKIKDLSQDDDDLFHIKGFFPDQVRNQKAYPSKISSPYEFIRHNLP